MISVAARAVMTKRKASAFKAQRERRMREKAAEVERLEIEYEIWVERELEALEEKEDVT